MAAAPPPLPAAYPPPPHTPALRPPVAHCSSLAAPHSAASSAGAPSSAVAIRSTLVSGLALRGAQLGEAAGARAGRRDSTRRALGPHGKLAQRASGEQAAAEQLLVVRHKILGPLPPPPDAVRGAMRDPELRHRVLRLTGRLLATAPLVIAECEEDGDDDDGEEEAGEDDDEGAETSASRAAPRRASRHVRVVMHRQRYERVSCGAGGGPRRFVIFAPWYEQRAACSEGGVQLLMAPLAEALV